MRKESSNLRRVYFLYEDGISVWPLIHFFVHTISHDTYSEMLPQTILLVRFLPSVKVSSHQHCIIKQKQKAIKVILRHTQDVHFSIDI